MAALLDMAQSQPLSVDEETLLGHYRRLKKASHDFKIEVFGSFKSGRRVVEVRPCAYYRLDVDQLEQVFEALD